MEKMVSVEISPGPDCVLPSQFGGKVEHNNTTAEAT